MTLLTITGSLFGKTQFLVLSLVCFTNYALLKNIINRLKNQLSVRHLGKEKKKKKKTRKKQSQLWLSQRQQEPNQGAP